MADLHFMHRQFSGLCLKWDEAIEDEEFTLLFSDSWYWLHYCFLNCRDCILSENSSSIRANLYNTAALFLRNLEHLCRERPGGISQRRPDEVFDVIAEIIEIAEYSKSFPICLWIFGDDTSKTHLDEQIAKLPPPAQIESLMQLPHYQRIERDRLPYMSYCEQGALKRYRNEVAAFNKRLNERNRLFQQHSVIECKPAQDLTLLFAGKSAVIH